MAPQPTFIKVFFRDDGNTVREVVYRMATEIDPAVASTLTDVATDAAAIQTNLNTLTGDHIDKYQVYWDGGGGGAAAEDTSNNQITAFTRTRITSTGDNSSIEVPSWAHGAYDRDEQNFLNAAYDSDVGPLMLLIVDFETGLPMESLWSQSRTRKLRGKRVG